MDPRERKPMSVDVSRLFFLNMLWRFYRHRKLKWHIKRIQSDWLWIRDIFHSLNINATSWDNFFFISFSLISEFITNSRNLNELLLNNKQYNESLVCLNDALEEKKIILPTVGRGRLKPIDS